MNSKVQPEASLAMDLHELTLRAGSESVELVSPGVGGPAWASSPWREAFSALQKWAKSGHIAEILPKRR